MVTKKYDIIDIVYERFIESEELEWHDLDENIVFLDI